MRAAVPIRNGRRQIDFGALWGAQASAIAIGAVIELPNRRFDKGHKAVLDEDIEALGSFFLREAHGVLEEQVVRNSLGFLYAIGDAACGGARRASLHGAL